MVALMFFYQMAVVSAFIVGRTARDTLFLQRVDLDSLPLMYMVVAGAVALASVAYSRIADKTGRHAGMQPALIFFAAVYAFIVSIWF